MFLLYMLTNIISPSREWKEEVVWYGAAVLLGRIRFSNFFNSPSREGKRKEVEKKKREKKEKKKATNYL